MGQDSVKIPLRSSSSSSPSRGRTGRASPRRTDSPFARPRPGWGGFRIPIRYQSKWGIQGLSFGESPLNGLAHKRPSEVFVSVFNIGKEFWFNPVAIGFLMGLVSLDFGLTTVQLLTNLRHHAEGSPLPRREQWARQG